MTKSETQTHSVEVTEVLAKRAAQVQKGGARAAVLGVNDGLVSTVCLVVGVAAAGGSQQAVLTAGFAGLLAGAISMAAGEWIAMRTQVELFEGVLDDLKTALETNKQMLKDNLAHTMAGYGLTHKDAHMAVEDIAKKDDDLIALYSAQVIGLNRDELGSPWHVAVSSFSLFAIGASVPVSVWIFMSDVPAMIGSVIVTALAGLGVGAITARLSGRSEAYGALRQFSIVAFAAAITYGIGSLFGVILG